jgi:hypothetical protein
MLIVINFQRDIWSNFEIVEKRTQTAKIILKKFFENPGSPARLTAKTLKLYEFRRLWKKKKMKKITKTKAQTTVRSLRRSIQNSGFHGMIELKNMVFSQRSQQTTI